MIPSAFQADGLSILWSARFAASGCDQVFPARRGFGLSQSTIAIHQRTMTRLSGRAPWPFLPNAAAAAIAWLLFAFAMWSPVAMAENHANVLVLFSQNRLLPANIEADEGLHQGHSPDEDVRLFAEFLDAPVFAGAAYEARTAAYLREKYSAHPPRVLVAAGRDALHFMLRYRRELFPGVPIVHFGVDRPFLETVLLPPDVVGTPADYDIAGTLGLAIRLHPNARQLVVVTGSSAWDNRQTESIRAAIAELRPALPIEYLVGAPMKELLDRLAALTAETVVLTPGFVVDGDGRQFTPRESIESLAERSAAPMYVYFTSQIGSGAVGGRMTSFQDMGRAARVSVDALIGGAAPTSVSVPHRLPTPVRLDARQLRRWNVRSELIPPDAVLYYRESSFWETYRLEAIIVAIVLLVQAGLIAALLIERAKRRRTASALMASERRSQLAARAARLQTFVWDFAGGRPERGSTSDEAGAEVLPAQESFDQVLASVHPADRHRLQIAVREALSNEGELDVEYRSVHPDGEIRWMAVRGHLASGEADALTGIRMDITSRKAAELQSESDRATLTHVARIATMGQLSAAIAHQLNQPLAAILGNAETARKLLQRDPSRLDDVREMLDDVIVEDLRAADIIRRLGDLYRRGETEATSVDLNELVSETLGLVHAELVLRHVTAVTELATPLPAVRGSRVQLQQVVLNLVLNAADAMAQTDGTERVVTLGTAVEDGLVHLCVKDRGTGIAPGDLKRIFEPFWTTKSGGIGMGLAICNTIVAAHRGTLTAHNNADGGAAFCLNLPPGEPA